MKSKILILILTVLLTSIYGKVTKVEIASRAIADILMELSEVYSVRFKIVIIGNEPNLKRIADRIMRRSPVPVNIIKHDNNSSDAYKIHFNEPQIILSDYNYRKEYFVIRNKSDSFTRYLNYKNSFIIEYFHSGYLRENFTQPVKNSAYHREYIIFQNEKRDGSLLMFNNVLFHSNSCDSIFKSVNIFSSSNMTWKSTAKSYVQNFINFHKCSIHVWASKSTRESNSFLMKIEHKTENRLFVDGYHGEFANIFAEKFQITYDREFVNENQDIYFEFIIVDVADHLNFNYMVSHITTPLYCYDFTFVVTRGAKYTPLEKLILPFDGPTWLLIILMFAMGYSTIFVLHRFPMELREIVFGDRSLNPSLNLMLIFFGFGLNQVPRRNFARFLFLMFVLYCLIIRTAYQGKMYEFMTADVRKPTATTVEEMFDMNIPIIITSEQEAATFKMLEFHTKFFLISDNILQSIFI